MEGKGPEARMMNEAARTHHKTAPLYTYCVTQRRAGGSAYSEIEARARNHAACIHSPQRGTRHTSVEHRNILRSLAFVVSVAMACLRAWLLGDIATLYFPARKDDYREGDSNVDDDFDDDDGQGELRERKEGLGYILDRGFGKVGKVRKAAFEL